MLDIKSEFFYVLC